MLLATSSQTSANSRSSCLTTGSSAFSASCRYIVACCRRCIFPTKRFVSYRCNRQTQLVRGAHLRLFQALLPNALPYTGVSIPFVFCNPSTPQHLDRLSRRASTKKTSLIDDAPRGSFRFLPSSEKREHWRAPLGMHQG